LVEVVGTVIDVTERKRAEDDHVADPSTLVERLRAVTGSIFLVPSATPLETVTE